VLDNTQHRGNVNTVWAYIFDYGEQRLKKGSTLPDHGIPFAPGLSEIVVGACRIYFGIESRSSYLRCTVLQVAKKREAVRVERVANLPLTGREFSGRRSLLESPRRRPIDRTPWAANHAVVDELHLGPDLSGHSNNKFSGSKFVWPPEQMTPISDESPVSSAFIDFRRQLGIELHLDSARLRYPRHACLTSPNAPFDEAIDQAVVFYPSFLGLSCSDIGDNYEGKSSQDREYFRCHNHAPTHIQTNSSAE
jgi:hypothetical protein